MACILKYVPCIFYDKPCIFGGICNFAFRKACESKNNECCCRNVACKSGYEQGCLGL